MHDARQREASKKNVETYLKEGFRKNEKRDIEYELKLFTHSKKELFYKSF